jgi:hypothetical protein
MFFTDYQYSLWAWLMSNSFISDKTVDGLRRFLKIAVQYMLGDLPQ